MNDKKVNYLKDGLLILILATFFGAALAGVNYALQPIITANKLQETLGKVAELVPGAVAGEKQTIGDMVVYKGVDAEQKLVGWLIPAKGQGFADKIELLLGVNADGSQITGMYVIDQKETPGLGDKIKSDLNWGKQYLGKATSSEIEVTKSAPKNQQIQAITGATISSESVTKIVNQYATNFRNALSEVN
jgi:electron transport complex protein RnfG